MGSMKQTIVIALVLVFKLCAADSGNQAYRDGRYSAAEKSFIEALRTAPDESGTITFNLAATYRAQARYSDAEQLYRKVIAIRQNALGPRHPSLATPLDGLALTCLSEGKPDEAEDPAARAMAIDASPRTMNVLAMVLSDRGKYERAESLARSAASLAEPSTIEQADLISTLAMVNRRRGKFEKAEALYRESAALFERIAGTESPATAATWNNLAQVLVARHRMAEAAVLYGRAAIVLERVYGPGDFRVMAVARNYARAHGTLVVNVAANSQVPHCRPEICLAQ